MEIHYYGNGICESQRGPIPYLCEKDDERQSQLLHGNEKQNHEIATPSHSVADTHSRRMSGPWFGMVSDAEAQVIRGGYASFQWYLYQKMIYQKLVY